MNRHRPPVPSQYDDDFYAWTQQQAEAWRALDKHTATLPVQVDLGAIAEEIEDLGKADLNVVVGLTQQILIHLIKAVSAPDAMALSHWRVEATAFSLRLARRYVPSMRRNVDMQSIWDDAVKIAGATLEEYHGALARKSAQGMSVRAGWDRCERVQFRRRAGKAGRLARRLTLRPLVPPGLDPGIHSVTAPSAQLAQRSCARLLGHSRPQIA